MDLQTLNARWEQTDKPHAVGEGDAWHWACPQCQGQGRTKMALVGAMSDALAHKNKCPSVILPLGPEAS